MALLLHKLIWIMLCGTIILLDPVTSEETKRECGVFSPDATTAGKSNSIGNLNTFPWTVIIADGTKELCLGSLIHPKVVLTVAHCLQNPIFSAENITILGDERRQKRTAIKTITHPKKQQFSYDFGLIVLDKAITLDEHVNTICLPPQDHDTVIGTKCLVSSWSISDNKEEKYEKKLHLNLTTIGRKENKEKFQDLRLPEKFNDTVLSVTKNEPRDSDNGDSGAPMICLAEYSNADQFHQIGISSFGVSALSSLPTTGFVNVASARSWIDEVMKENELDTSSYTI